MRDDDLQLSLVWQAKNGNAQALNALLDANKGKIYAAAYALLKNREDAEDAMQQALIAVWQNIGKLAAPEAFETWLYRVTYTRSLNILKSRKNNEMVIENLWLEPDIKRTKRIKNAIEKRMKTFARFNDCKYE